MYEIQSAWEVNNPFTELTEREMEVIRLISDGLSNTNIANQLVISEKTVKGHVSNILGNFIWLTAPGSGLRLAYRNCPS